MSKPTRTEAELVAMARAELKVHADCPDGIEISVIRTAEGWEFRTAADEAAVAKPGYPECVRPFLAMTTRPMTTRRGSDSTMENHSKADARW